MLLGDIFISFTRKEVSEKIILLSVTTWMKQEYHDKQNKPEKVENHRFQSYVGYNTESYK